MSSRPDLAADAVDLHAVDLAAVEAMAERWCGSVDPAVLAGSDAAQGAERLALVIRRYQAVQVLLARRADECNSYAARARSGADWLAGVNGTSKAEAARSLETARRLEGCPATLAAFSAGEISTDEADAVSGAAAADPTCEQRLLEGAKACHDLRETRQAADKVRRAARSAEDEAARHARLHKSRALRISESPEGHVTIRGQFTPAAFSGVKPVIDAHMKLRVEQARRDGTREGWDAYRADAFLDAISAGAAPGVATRSVKGAAERPAPTTREATAKTATAAAATTPAPSAKVTASPTPAASAANGRPIVWNGAEPGPFDPPYTMPIAPPSESGPLDLSSATRGLELASDGRLFTPGDEIAEAEGLDPKINWNLVILVDGIALKRGYTAAGETCEIPGIGPIPVAWIQRLLPRVHTEMLIHDSVDIRAYATSTRHRTRPVELAVRVRDRECVVPRCHRDPTEFDHRVPFVETHDTSVANGNRVCTPDHRDKTHHGAILERDATDWNYWPPGTDPATDQPLTAPIGRHLTPWNLDHLPDPDPDPDPEVGDEPPTLDLR